VSSVTRILTCTILAIVFAPVAYAGPGDLLDQAIEENDGREQPKVNAGEVADIVARANRLYDQRSFSKAVELYEAAYRLAPNDRANFARMLVARRAAGIMTESDREALAIIEEESRASVASTFRTVRLNVIQAREALGSNDFTLAESLIVDAEFALRNLPTDVDATPYWRQLTQLRKSVARNRGFDSTPHTPAVPTTALHKDSDVLLLGDTTENESTDPAPAVEASVVADNSETGEILDVDAMLTATQRRLEYDRDLDRALAAARADVILTATEAALPPSANGGMTFPSDWTDRVAKRSKNRGGVIYRTPDFTGPDGQTYHTAVYDLGDLVHPVPNFYAPWALTGWQQRVQMEDRAALRNRSQIFNGYADDLAAGLPLLHFFGGVDNYAVSTRTDPRETARVLNTIEQFMR
jgi:hypothetical protein